MPSLFVIASAGWPQPIWLTVMTALLAAALLAIGLRLLFRLRRGQSMMVRLPVLGPSSQATGLAVSFSSILIGYHLLAWILPPDWLQLRVPIERWWMLVAGTAVAIGSSWLIDRSETPDEWREPEPGPSIGDGSGGDRADPPTG